MWLIHQFDSLLNLGTCKEYPIMARAKTPRNNAGNTNGQTVAPAVSAAPPETVSEIREVRKTAPDALRDAPTTSFPSIWKMKSAAAPTNCGNSTVTSLGARTNTGCWPSAKSWRAIMPSASSRHNPHTQPGVSPKYGTCGRFRFWHTFNRGREKNDRAWNFLQWNSAAGSHPWPSPPYEIRPMQLPRSH